ncbi:hypothetical protein BH11MYX3_BH11MYX3_04680 [soil metagenome]
MSGRITSTEAAKILGITRQAITSSRMDRLLRPAIVGRVRTYSRMAIERLRAARDAELGADLELNAFERDYAPIEDEA